MKGVFLIRLIIGWTLMLIVNHNASASDWYAHVSSGDISARATAAFTWQGTLSDSAEVRDEIDRALADSDPLVRRSAAITLGYADKLSPEWRIEQLQTLTLTEKHALVLTQAEAALAAIADTHPTSIIDLLTNAASHPAGAKIAERAAVALAIASTTDEDIDQLLAKKFPIHAVAIKNTARMHLDNEPWSDHSQPLPFKNAEEMVNHYRETDSQTCLPALSFIAQQGAESTRQRLIEWIFDDNGTDQGCLLLALGTLPGAFKAMEASLDKSDLDQRWLTLQLLRTRQQSDVKSIEDFVLNSLLSGDEDIFRSAFLLVDQQNLWTQLRKDLPSHLSQHGEREFLTLIWQIRTGVAPVEAVQVLMKKPSYVEMIAFEAVPYDDLFEESSSAIFTDYFDDVIRHSSSACIPSQYLIEIFRAIAESPWELEDILLTETFTHDSARKYLRGHPDCNEETRDSQHNQIKQLATKLWHDPDVNIRHALLISSITDVWPNLNLELIDDKEGMNEIEQLVSIKSAASRHSLDDKEDRHFNPDQPLLKHVNHTDLLRVLLIELNELRDEPKELQMALQQIEPWMWAEYQDAPVWILRAARDLMLKLVEETVLETDQEIIVQRLVDIYDLGQWVRPPKEIRALEQHSSVVARYTYQFLFPGLQTESSLSLAEAFYNTDDHSSEYWNVFLQFEESELVRYSILSDLYFADALTAARRYYRNFYRKNAPPVSNPEIYTAIVELRSAGIPPEDALDFLDKKFGTEIDLHSMINALEAHPNRFGQHQSNIREIIDYASRALVSPDRSGAGGPASAPFEEIVVAGLRASSGLPELWPLPPFSKQTVLNKSANLSDRSLEDVHRLIIATLSSGEYPENGLFAVPNGFAIASGLERIDKEGKPIMSKRFLPTIQRAGFGLDLLYQLVSGFRGEFRSFVFVVTDKNKLDVLADMNQPIDVNQGGAFPSSWRNIPMADRNIFLIVYHYEKINGYYRLRLSTQTQPALYHLESTMEVAW